MMDATSTKVLLIDDDQCIGNLIRIYLSRKERFDVVVCDNADDGLSIATTEKPDIILLDWVMPGTCGIEVLRALRDDSRTRDIPTVMLTGKNLLKEVEAAFSLGAEGYLTKPVELPRMALKLRDVLARRQSSNSKSFFDGLLRNLRLI